MTNPTSNAFDLSVIASSALGTAATSIAAGQSLNVAATLGRPNFTDAEYAWQAQFQFSPNALSNGVVQAWGKQAGDTHWSQGAYDIAANVWRQAWNYTNISGSSGHVYGNNTIDPATGTGYVTQDKHLWGFPPDGSAPTDYGIGDIEPGGSELGYMEGIGWHPNLFGVGDGGVVIVSASNFHFWRKQDNTWHNKTAHPDTSNSSYGTYSNGQTQYLKALDALFCYCTAKGANYCWKITSGPVITNFTMSPNLPTMASSNSKPWLASILRDPYDYDNKLMLLKMPVQGDTTPSNRECYRSSDGINWTDAGFYHPFTMSGASNGYTVCSLPAPYRCCWRLGLNDTPLLWKPNS